MDQTNHFWYLETGKPIQNRRGAIFRNLSVLLIDKCSANAPTNSGVPAKLLYIVGGKRSFFYVLFRFNHLL